MTDDAGRHPLRHLLWFALADLVAIAVFVAVGRRSHAEAASVVGYLNALWPFLTGAVIGWISASMDSTRTDRSLTGFHPEQILPAGATIWGGTVLLGFGLRWVSGQTIAWSFFFVALIATGVLLLGWRSLYAYFRSRRARS